MTDDPMHMVRLHMLRRADLKCDAAMPAVSFIDPIKPARQIVNDMLEEALSVFEEITGESADA